MNEKEAHKLLTDAGFQTHFDDPHLVEMAYEDSDALMKSEWETPMWLTIGTITYSHKELRDVFPVVFITRGKGTHSLPKEAIEKYEGFNDTTVKDALNKYNYMVLMRFCT